MSNELNDFKKALGGQVVAKGSGRRGALDVGSALALREWFDDRRKHIASSGGRPTNPEWTLKRQIPFDDATWIRLKEIADLLSEEHRKMSPGQVAAIVLREAILEGSPIMAVTARSSSRVKGTRSELAKLHPKYQRWRQPEVFAA